MIDTNKWSQFDCRELFECKNTGNILARDVMDGSGGTPYVTSSAYNNGVVAHIDATNYEIIKGHCILVGGKTFTITYQKDDFVSNDSHNFTVRVKDYDISDYSYLYLATIIYGYFGQKYSWNDAVTKDKFMDERVPLPTTSEGQPDWDYMESYMKAVMEESEKSLENLKKADDTKHLIDVSGWGEFDVTKFFTVLAGRAKLSNADIDDGNTPVYSSNSTNGGVFGYTTKTPDYEVNDENPFYITFGDHTKAVNIADKSFCVMDNVKVLTSNICNYNVLYFIITSWLRNVPDLGYARHWSEAEKAKIWLPITSTGEPHWQYMEDYMRRIMDKSEKIISDLQIGA